MARRLEAAAEAAEVLGAADHKTFAKAVGLKNAVSAGVAPPAAFIRDVLAALQEELKKSADAASPAAGIDSGMTRATKSTLRGVLKRFEDAFGSGRKGTGRA